MPIEKQVLEQMDKANVHRRDWSWFKYVQKQIDYYERLEKAELLTEKQTAHLEHLRELAKTKEHNQCLTLARRIGYHGLKLEFPGLSK